VADGAGLGWGMVVATVAEGAEIVAGAVAGVSGSPVEVGARPTVAAGGSAVGARVGVPVAGAQPARAKVNNSATSSR